MDMTETEILQMFKDEGFKIDNTIFPDRVFLVFPPDVLDGGRRFAENKIVAEVYANTGRGTLYPQVCLGAPNPYSISFRQSRNFYFRRDDNGRPILFNDCEDLEIEDFRKMISAVMEKYQLLRKLSTQFKIIDEAAKL